MCAGSHLLYILYAAFDAFSLCPSPTFLRMCCEVIGKESLFKNVLSVTFELYSCILKNVTIYLQPDEVVCTSSIIIHENMLPH